MARAREDQRIPVGRRLRHDSGADRAARTGTVLHDHGASECGAELRIDRARYDVLHSASSERHDEADHRLRMGHRRRERESEEPSHSLHQSWMIASYIATDWRM